MLRPDQVRIQINDIKLSYPELTEDADMLADVLEGQTDLFEVLRLLVNQDQEARLLAEAVQDSIDAMVSRKQRFKRRSEALRGMMQNLMDDAGQRKLELPEATLSVRNVPGKVIIISEDELPDGCVRIKREPDKTAIKERITSEGGCPGATMSNGSETISVRYT